MPEYAGQIVLVKGNVLRVNRNISLLPSNPNQTADKAWLTIKEKVEDADPGKLQISINTSPASAGQVIDPDGTDGLATVAFVLSVAQTTTFDPDYLYYYDIKIHMTTGEVYTPEQGRLLVKQFITQAAT